MQYNDILQILHYIVKVTLNFDIGFDYLLDYLTN